MNEKLRKKLERQKEQTDNQITFRQNNFTGKLKTEKFYNPTQKDLKKLLKKSILDELNEKNNGHIKPSFVKYIKRANYKSLVRLAKKLKVKYLKGKNDD